MKRIVFDVVEDYRVILSDIYKCGEGQTECLAPKWVKNDTKYEQVMMAHFNFDVYSFLNPDKEYQMVIRGEQQDYTTIWSL